VFLNDETRNHFKDPKPDTVLDEKFDKAFAGTEWVDLKIELAKAMSEKAHSPQEVLGIWKAALNKNAISEVAYEDV
jgi:hypothetical protein